MGVMCSLRDLASGAGIPLVLGHKLQWTRKLGFHGPVNPARHSGLFFG